MRPLLVPSTAPRTHLHHRPEPLSEVVVRRPGTAPVHRVVPSREVTAELLERLEAEIEDLPRLALSREEGAVDLKLEAPDGSQVKSGTIVLEGPRGKVAVAIDPSTRRFRSGGLAPGAYQVHAASAETGRGALRLEVRPGDVTRAAVRLDGEALQGTATVRMALRGTRARRVKVRATDRSTGRVVFEGAAEVERGEIVVTDVPFGRLHWDVDDEDARSCYDTDVSDLVEIFREPLRVELIPKLPIEPDPPDWLVLPRDFASLVQVLPELGVRSIEELAAAEPEGLMHRAKDLESRGLLPVHSRLFADAIDAARKSLGLRGQEGEELRELRLGPGATFTRTVLPRSAGEVDAAPFIIERTRPNEPTSPMEFDYLREFRELLSWRRGDAVILAEANAEKEELVEYFGATGDRLPMLFNFLLNQRLFLALARGDATPIVSALEAAPRIPDSCQWATFLRNHDEIDLGRLSDKERAECFAAFGPEERMQLYGRGIRRRLAPMLGNDRRRIELAYSLQLTLPGTPVLRYGEEIGMGDDLSLKERDAIRTPMQWSGGPNAGFSAARRKSDLHHPVISGGDFGYETVNVEAQRCDPGSLLHWMEQALHTLRECPEFGIGKCTPVDTGDAAVLALHHEAPGGAMLALHNLSDKKRTVDVGEQPGQDGVPFEMFADQDYDPVGPALKAIDLAGYGYRWIRLRDTPGR